MDFVLVISTISSLVSTLQVFCSLFTWYILCRKLFGFRSTNSRWLLIQSGWLQLGWAPICPGKGQRLVPPAAKKRGSTIEPQYCDCTTAFSFCRASKTLTEKRRVEHATRFNGLQTRPLLSSLSTSTGKELNDPGEEWEEMEGSNLPFSPNFSPCTPETQAVSSSITPSSSVEGTPGWRSRATQARAFPCSARRQSPAACTFSDWKRRRRRRGRRVGGCGALGLSVAALFCDTAVLALDSDVGEHHTALPLDGAEKQGRVKVWWYGPIGHHHNRVSLAAVSSTRGDRWW